MTDSDRALLGVVSLEKAIVPLQCVGCDCNAYYRWVGDTYEAGVHAVGEVVFPDVTSKTPVKLFASATDAPQPMAELPPGTELRVLGYGPHYETQHGRRTWHQVAANVDGKKLTGFVRAESLMDESEWHERQELIASKKQPGHASK